MEICLTFGEDEDKSLMCYVFEMLCSVIVNCYGAIWTFFIKHGQWTDVCCVLAAASVLVISVLVVPHFNSDAGIWNFDNTFFLCPIIINIIHSL